MTKLRVSIVECRASVKLTNSKLWLGKFISYIPGQQRARSLVSLIFAREINNLMNNNVLKIR
jgi:hypothetical protein